LQAAESIANEKKMTGDPLKFVQGKAKWELVTTFLKAECPEEWADFQAERTTFQQYEKAFKEDSEAADALKKFCKSFSASYAPLFGFRSSLFESLDIKDPKGFILDLSNETLIDPIHLLRYYEFAASGEEVEIIDRAAPPYQISFRLRYRGDRLDFLATQMNKLKAFEDCRIELRRDNAIAPTPLLSKLEKELIPGIIMCPITNAPAYYRIRQERIATYPVTISGNNFEREYAFLPGLPGILTLAMCGVKLKLPDDEEFLIF
jgi:CRISPR-associated endonuclease/helicase Cas3